MSRKKLIGIVAACIIVVIVVLVISLSRRGPVDGPLVTFPDPNLETAIKEALNKPSEPIHASELAGLASLSASDRGIEDLSGLQYCTSLAELDLISNQIGDISPLASLTKLINLALGWNQISDISPLANVTKLTNLCLSSNQISDISPLVQNEGLGAGDEVTLSSNPLSSDSINIYIPELEARGVTVNY
jgi:Leucine-rich repeat (LRR) protein